MAGGCQGDAWRAAVRRSLESRHGADAGPRHRPRARDVIRCLRWVVGTAPPGDCCLLRPPAAPAIARTDLVPRSHVWALPGRRIPAAGTSIALRHSPVATV